MMKNLTLISCVAIFSFLFSHSVLAKGSTLVDGSGKPVKVAGGCAKVTKSAKSDFHYSACHKIKPKKVK
jgi:hypothetical protein